MQASQIRTAILFQRGGEAPTSFVAQAAAFDMSIRQSKQTAVSAMLTMAC
jgi:hypothetical protein